MIAWTLAGVGIFVVIVATLWYMDWSHKRRLEEHDKRMAAIYRDKRRQDADSRIP